MDEKTGGMKIACFGMEKIFFQIQIENETLEDLRNQTQKI